ncbi:MAG: hypothetical protein ABL993_15570 [Vicinamibacterales bacterium]
MKESGFSALVLGLTALAFRVLSSADLSNDHYMHLAWAQQLLFGQLPGRDFVDPGMPLAYAISAAAQWMRPGPFTELVLSAALLGLAAAVTYLVAERLSGSAPVAIGVTLLEVAFQPRFYSYPKILVPAVAMLIFQRYADKRTLPWLVTLGVWTGLAGLLRHDLAVYAAVGISAGLLALRWPDRRRAFSSVAVYGSLVTATLIPYALFVRWSEGIAEHLRRGLEFSKAEAHQRIFALPPLTSFDFLAWGREDAAAFLFYAAHAAVLITIAILLGRRIRHSPEERAAATAATAMLAAYLAVILRHPLDARLPDLAAVVAIVLAWILGQAWQVVAESLKRGPTGITSSGSTSFARFGQATLVAAAAMALALSTARSVWVLEKLPEAIDNTGVYGGVNGMVDTVTDLKERGSVWPWARSWPSRELPDAVRYLNECTEPTDALLTTWPAPEYGFFARRPFAAGHAEFLPPRAFATDTDQQQMLAWLRAQRVPVALVNEPRREEFAGAYPKIDAYLRAGYREAGRFTIYDGSNIIVAVRSDLRGRRTWGPQGWPCDLEPVR